MTTLKAWVPIIALAIGLLGSWTTGVIKYRDLLAQVTKAVESAESVETLPARVDSLQFAAKLQGLWFTCVQIQGWSEERCRKIYFNALQSGQFPDWASVGPPEE
jgi:hypothetical protein